MTLQGVEFGLFRASSHQSSPWARFRTRREGRGMVDMVSGRIEVDELVERREVVAVRTGDILDLSINATYITILAS